MSLSFAPFVAQDASSKRDRSAFVYFERNIPNFAQCGSCALQEASLCSLLAKKVSADDSCALYIPGPDDNDKFSNEWAEPTQHMTPEEAGFVNGPVRCEHCVSFEGGVLKTCQLFTQLNDAMPELFNLDDQVSPNGCCNAWSKK